MSIVRLDATTLKVIGGVMMIGAIVVIVIAIRDFMKLGKT